MGSSRWLTIEFGFYYCVLAFAVYKFTKITWDMSSEERPYYEKYQHRLANGWIFGSRKIDNSDAQYRFFRSNLLLLSIAFSLLTLISHFFKRVQGFQLVYGLVFLVFLHGISSIDIIIICLTNYAIAKIFKGHFLCPVLTWIFNIFVLFWNEFSPFRSYKEFSHILALLDELPRGTVANWGSFFKFSVLRMISFNYDYYLFSIKKPVHHKKDECSVCSTDDACERFRSEEHHPRSTYSLINYFSYLFYPPLFLSGPIISFNNFMSQLRFPCKELNAKQVIIYGIRLVGAILLMELMLHAFHVVAIKDAKAWDSLNGTELAALGYWNLKIIWLKLLIMWRFFRFFAMADGILPLENMLRCMSNNYSAQGFWRSWHRSYNQWNVRYLYVPLGGSRTAAWNIFVVFSFVAVWHDIQLNLLAWGWLISLFVLPEMAGEFLRKWPPFRHLAALGGCLNILLMMIANLVGFAIGIKGTTYLLEQTIFKNGMYFLSGCLLVLFSAVQIMFEIREEEQRQGIKNNF